MKHTILNACIADMPQLSHKTSEPFDVHSSEVVAWLVGQGTVLQWMFDTAKTRGLIVFDPAEQKWRGIGEAKLSAPKPPRQSEIQKMESAIGSQPPDTGPHRIAEILGVSFRTVRRRLDRSRIYCIKNSRICLRDGQKDMDTPACPVSATTSQGFDL